MYLSLFLCLFSSVSFFIDCLSLQTRVAAIFVFVSFTALLSIAGVPTLLKEIKVMLAAILCLMLTSRSWEVFLVNCNSSVTQVNKLADMLVCV